VRAEPEQADAIVVGLGYVGLVFAATLAEAGLRVIGVERSPAARAAIRAGRALFREPGLDELLGRLPPGAMDLREGLAGVRARVVILCVGTGYDRATGTSDLSDLHDALGVALEAVSHDTLLIVRSTVPVGSCRSAVLPRLAQVSSTPMLAYCPERTMQGQAVAEIRALPQIIGGFDELSACRAAEIFRIIGAAPVTVTSLEAAELVKLICNAHTDMIYAFGNEVAFMAEALGLSAREVIEAAGRGYPRPTIAWPGYVGGSCLIKDPYLLVESSRAAGYQPRLVPAARLVNERLPGHVAELVAGWLDDHRVPASQAKVLLCGIAYKGQPETDDVRGAASPLIARALAGRVGHLAGHDPVLGAEVISAIGLRPSNLEAGLAGAHALVLLTDHPAYRSVDWHEPLAGMARPALVVDVWCLLPDLVSDLPWISYRGFGNG